MKRAKKTKKVKTRRRVTSVRVPPCPAVIETKPPRRFKSIYEHSDTELNEAIERAVKLEPNFYLILHGVDAYMERRARRRARAKERKERILNDVLDFTLNWHGQD